MCFTGLGVMLLGGYKYRKYKVAGLPNRKKSNQAVRKPFIKPTVKSVHCVYALPFIVVTLLAVGVATKSFISKIVFKKRSSY
jgi:hypothetical protein